MENERTLRSGGAAVVRRAVIVLTLAIAVFLGGVGAGTASAAAPYTTAGPVAATSVSSPHLRAGYPSATLVLPRQPRLTLSFWSWEWSFVKCVVGIGAPIGAAWAIVTNPWTWAYVIGAKPLKPQIGRTMYNYIHAVKGACGRYVRG